MTASDRKELEKMVARMQAILARESEEVDAAAVSAVRDTKPQPEDYAQSSRRLRRARGK